MEKKRNLENQMNGFKYFDKPRTSTDRVFILNKAKLESISKSFDGQNETQTSLFYTGDNNKDNSFISNSTNADVSNMKKNRRNISHGLLNKDDPSKVTFVEESQWLEKLCKEEVAANKTKQGKHRRTRSQDFLEIGSPLLPGCNKTKVEPPLDKDYIEEKEKRRSKHFDVVEEKSSVVSRKSWLDNIVKEEEIQKSRRTTKGPKRAQSLENLLFDDYRKSTQAVKDHNDDSNSLNDDSNSLNDSLSSHDNDETNDLPDRGNNMTFIPSIRSKLKMFQKKHSNFSTKSNNLASQGKSKSETNLCPTSDTSIAKLGSTLLANDNDNIELVKSNNEKTTKRNNTRESRNISNSSKPKLSLKDQRIQKEIEELELREKEYKQSRLSVNSNEQNGQNVSKQPERDYRKLPKGLQAFLLENELN